MIGANTRIHRSLSPRWWRLCVFVFVFLVLATALLARLELPAIAQTGSSEMRGRVLTGEGTPVPGATLIARNLQTSTSFQTITNAAGEFAIPQLPPGTYSIELQSDDLVLEALQEMALAGGQVQSFDLVANLSPRANRSRTTSLIESSQLSGLPLNGRNYSDLATLQAGIVDTGGSSASRGGSSGTLTISGSRSTSNQFLLDGTSIMDTNNRSPRSAAGGQLGSDGIAQVQVLGAFYGAEYGRDSGGVLNSITRAGTEEFHGTLFEYFRNSKLDSRNFFDDQSAPPFKRNQFGFMLTGPIRSQQTYFMSNFEVLRDRLTETDINFYPDAEARQGIITNANGEQTSRVDVSPRVEPYLRLYPMPTLSVGRGVGQYVSTQYQPSDENFFTVRVDHKASDRDSFFVRYSFDDATNYAGQSATVFRTLTESRQQYLTLVGSHIFSLQTLGAVRLSYTRPVYRSDTVSSITIPEELYFVRPGGIKFGTISIPGITSFGPSGIFPEQAIMNSYQFAGNLISNRGVHSITTGFDIHRYQWDLFSSFQMGGNWGFNSLENFLEGGSEGTSLTVALPGSSNAQAYRQTLTGLYVQDEYRVRPNLQLTLGLRYEFSTLIRDKFNRHVFMNDILRDREVQIGPFADHNPSLGNVAPRIGFRWTPRNAGNLLLSGGFGIYYEHLIAYVAKDQKATTPFFNMATIPNFDASGVFPDALAATTGGPFEAQIFDSHDMASPKVYRYTLTLQYELPGGLRLQAGYVGARGNNLYRETEANLWPVPVRLDDGTLFFPPGSDRGLNPNFRRINLMLTDAQSFYNALQITVSKSLGRGSSVQGNYTLSKSVDDGSTFSAAKQYDLMRTLERGLSDFDIRHRLSTSYFMTLPFGSGQRWLTGGPLEKLIGGWRIGGIFRYRTGTPFTAGVNVQTEGYLFSATRPNLVSGRSNNPILGDRERYFDPTAFSVPAPGTMGNLGRNTLKSPRVVEMDLSLQKEFPLDGKRRLQFRGEIFNLPNHTNFGSPSSNVYSGSSGRLSSTVGRITRTVTTSRQIQLALRFYF